jgi:hypothetical protein
VGVYFARQERVERGSKERSERAADFGVDLREIQPLFSSSPSSICSLQIPPPIFLKFDELTMPYFCIIFKKNSAKQIGER